MSLDRRLFKSLDRSLRAKVTLSVVLPLTLILGGFTAIEHARQQKALLTNLSFLAAQTGQVIEDSVLHEMVSWDLAGLQNMLDAVGKSEAIRVVYLLNTFGQVVFAPQGEGTGTELDNRDPTCQPCHRLSPAERPSSVVVSLPEGQRVFRSMNPIENRPACQECHGSDERLLGLLLTDISMAALEGPLAARLRENLLWWIATLVVTVLVANLAISRFVVQRVKGLAAAIADLGKGQSPSPLPESHADEIGRLAGAFNTMARQVKARHVENRALSESLRRQSAQRGELLRRLITAQEDERKRVARELHDALGQSLAGLTFRLEAMERLIVSDPERAIEQLSQILALGGQTADRMYDLILDLRPSALDDLGLVAALRAHGERLLNGTGIDFELDAGGLTGRLPPEVETTLYRTFQEALNNVVRHAKAERVRITLARRDGVFDGEILDDGQGFDLGTVRIDGQSPRGLGLLGMQERVAQCGGQLEIVSQPSGGTRLCICIPLEEATID